MPWKYLEIIHELPVVSTIKGMMNFINKVNKLVCSGITRPKSKLVFGDKVLVHQSHISSFPHIELR